MRISPVIVTFAPHKQNINNKHYYDYGKEMALSLIHISLKYAHEREQFGKPIIRFAAVSEMLSNMKAKLQGVRALLYETTRFVEVYKQYGHIAHERSLEGEERQEMKFYNRLADGFTPLVKLFSSEYANQQAYDAIDVYKRQFLSFAGPIFSPATM